MCKILHLDYYVMQFLVTLFFSLSALNFCKRYSKYPLAAYCIFVVYFFHPMMCQIRQNIALGILLFGIPYIFEKKFIKFELVVFLAFLFHKTAIICALLYFVRWRVFYKIRWAYPYIALFLFCVPTVVQSIASALGGLLFGDAAIAYLGNMLYNAAGISGGKIFAVMLLGKTFLLLLPRAENKEQEFFLALLGLYLIIYVCVAQIVILDRVAQYLELLHIIPLLYIIDIFYKKGKFFFPLILFFFGIFFITLPVILRMDTKGRNKASGRLLSYPYIPYYNAFWHPYYAEYRKDYAE